VRAGDARRVRTPVLPGAGGILARMIEEFLGRYDDGADHRRQPLPA